MFTSTTELDPVKLCIQNFFCIDIRFLYILVDQQYIFRVKQCLPKNIMPAKAEDNMLKSLGPIHQKPNP
jgi:hypothetical protein